LIHPELEKLPNPQVDTGDHLKALSSLWMCGPKTESSTSVWKVGRRMIPLLSQAAAVYIMIEIADHEKLVAIFLFFIVNTKCFQ